MVGQNQLVSSEFVHLSSSLIQGLTDLAGAPLSAELQCYNTAVLQVQSICNVAKSNSVKCSTEMLQFIAVKGSEVWYTEVQFSKVINSSVWYSAVQYHSVQCITLQGSALQHITLQ